MNKQRAVVAVITSALLYGFTPVICSLTYQLGNNPYTLTWFRSIFVLPLLIVLMKKNRVPFSLTLKEGLTIILIGIFGTVMTTLLLYSSYQYIGVGTATTLHFLYPLFVTLLCHFVYHDNMRRNQWMALGISLLGVALFVDTSDFSRLQGIIMALVSGFTFSVYLVGLDKSGLSKMNSYKLSFYLASVVAICLGGLDLVVHQMVWQLPPQVYGYMVIVAILAQFIAIILLKIGIEHLGSAIASLLSMFEPVSSVVFGYLFLQETVSIGKAIGCLLILCGVGLLLKKTRRAG